MLNKFRKNGILIVFTLFVLLIFNTTSTAAAQIPVSIISPTNNGTNVVVKGYGQPNASLDLMLDGSHTSGTVRPDGSWEIDLSSVTYGSHTINVIQTAGSYVSNAFTNFTVIKTAIKDIGLSDPDQLLTVTDSCPTIKGTSEPNAYVTISVNSKNYSSTADANGNWSIRITDKLENKEYILTLSEQESGFYRQALANMIVDAPIPVITPIEGIDKYDTSIKFSQLAFKTSETVILANGDSFADALCVIPLARYYNAPILLVSSTDKSLSDTISQEISRLGATHAIIIGGTGVIQQEIQDELTQKHLACERIGGKDRYETSYLIARRLPSSKSIAVVTGENYADALSISPAAGFRQMPILLNPYDSESVNISKYISENNVKTTYVIGSQGVLTQNAVKDMPNVIRIGGKDRYATNQLGPAQFKPTGKKLIVATGEDYPDALIGGAYAAMDDSQLILVGETLTQDVINAIDSFNYDNHILIGNINQMYSNNKK